MTLYVGDRPRRELTDEERALYVKAQFVGGPKARQWAAVMARQSRGDWETDVAKAQCELALAVNE